MKKRILKIKRILRSNAGETIMESIASLLVLAILLMAVTMMIQTSLRMTAASNVSATESQAGTVNSAILGIFSGKGKDIVFSAPGGEISAAHTVNFTNDDGIIAFIPLTPEE